MYSLRLNGAGAPGAEMGVLRGAGVFAPSGIFGVNGKFLAPSRAPLAWESVWAGNPQQGAHIELELSVPPS